MNKLANKDMQPINKPLKKFSCFDIFESLAAIEIIISSKSEGSS